MSEQQRTNINVGTTALEKQYIIYVLPINKISNQNSHILKMKLILLLITLAAISSYCSISALNFINKCYKCTDPEKNVQSSMEHK